MGDRPGDPDAAAVGDVREPGGGAHPLGVEPRSGVDGRVLLRADAGGGEVRGGQFENAHPGERGSVDLAEPGQHAGLLTGRGGRRPQGRAASSRAERVERPGGGQCLHLPDGQSGAPGEVGRGGVGAVTVALVGDRGGQILPDRPHGLQAEAHLGAVVLAGGAAERAVDARSVHGDTVPAGVGHQRLG